MAAVFKYQERKNNLKDNTGTRRNSVNWPTVILGRKSEVSMATNE